MPDARVQSAIDHWAPRFTGAGVDYNDFIRTTAAIERWEDWLDAWCETGEMHAELARESEAAGRAQTAGEAWLRAAVCFHFAKFVWVLDESRYRRVEIYDQLPPLNRETFVRKTHAADAEEARAVAVRMDLDGVLDGLDRPALFVTGSEDRLVPWQQTEMQPRRRRRAASS